MPSRPAIVPMAFPFLGIDRGTPPSELEPGKCLEARNVRAFPPISDRMGGGKRPGTSKALSDVAGTASTRRVSHLDVLTQASGIPSGSNGVATAVDTTVGGVTFGGYTAASPANMSQDLEAGALNNGRVQGSGDDAGERPDLVDVGGGQLEMQFGVDDGATGGSGFADDAPAGLAYISPRFRCINDITATFRAIGTVSAEGITIDKQATAMGPFVRGDDKLQRLYGARLTYTGTANSVVLQIVRIDVGSPNTITVLASAAIIAMDGTTTERTDLTINLIDDGATITATVNWPSMATATADATWNDGTLQVSYSTTDQNDQLRVGVWAGAGFNGDGKNRHLRRLQFTKFVPSARAVDSTINPAFDGPANYFLPSGFTAFAKTSGATPTTTIKTDPYASSTTAGNHPEVDNSADDLIFDSANYSGGTAPAVSGAVDTIVPTDGSRLGVQITLDSAQTETQDMGGAIFRCSDDFGSWLGIHLRAESTYNGDGQRRVNGIRITASRGLTTETDQIASIETTDFDYEFCIPYNGTYTITDDGTVVRIYVNNLLVYSVDVNALANYTTAISDALAGNTRAGLGPSYTRAGTAVAGIGIVRLVAGEDAPTVDVSEVEPKVLICTENKAQVGDLLADTIEDCTGPAFLNPLITSFSFNGKFYGVDSSRAKIVDPVGLTVTDWTDTVGSLDIAGFRLCALYKQSAILARTDDDPTFIAMSRRFAVTDFDFGADPQADTPIDFTANGSPGRPDKAITCIAPYFDDLCIIGTSDTMELIVGDPRRSGTMENLTRSTGIVGPRSFCFDSRGNFWFLGTGGLHVWTKGSDRPEPFSNKSLYRQLERLNASNTFVQLAFDKLTGFVHIHLTPTDGTTAGVHIVVDPARGSFFEDQFPADHGPWAIAESFGAEDQYRRFLMGGNDGYVRWLDDSSMSDDGEAIESFVEYAPIPDSGNRRETIATELQAILSPSSTSLTWRWFTGDSHSQVAAQAVGAESISGTFTGSGLNEPVGLRARGEAHKLRIEQTSASATWAVEEIFAEIRSASRVRKG